MTHWCQVKSLFVQVSVSHHANQIALLIWWIPLTATTPILYCWYIRCICRVTWLCCQLIARPGSGTTMSLWPDLYHLVTKALKQVKISIRIDNCYLLLLKYHYVLIMYCRTYIMFIITIVKCNIDVTCIVCTHVHWTIKTVKKKKIK